MFGGTSTHAVSGCVSSTGKGGVARVGPAAAAPVISQSTRELRIGQATTKRSVPSPLWSTLPVSSPYMLTTYSIGRAPSRFRFRFALRATRGS